MWPEAQAGVAQVFEAWRACRGAHANCFERWLAEFGSLYGQSFLHRGEREARTLRSIYRVPESAGFQEILFAVHTYFSQLIRTALRSRGIEDCAADPMFAWYAAEPGSAPLPDGSRDLFKPVYQALVPTAVRHALGEYYTPDWLAELVLGESGYEGDPDLRLLDPACGSGTFLVLAIERAHESARRRGIRPDEAARRILQSIHGLELNPLAAMAARANYALALHRQVRWAEIPVFVADAVLRPIEAEPFDFVVGNPPWVRWDYLPEEHRRSTLPLWKHYGLFTLRGFDARLGGGKKDLSMLFTYAAADRYLKDGGRLAFLITQEVFKAKGAGEGFRRFRLRESGPPLRVLKAHDFVKLQPFDGAANKTAAIFLTKGETTTYPVPYVVWRRDRKGLQAEELRAEPVGSPSGPWRTARCDAEPRFPLCATSPYRAMLGANANPYGVFWLEVLETLAGGLARIRNLPEKGKREIPPVEATIESDLVYPAVRGADLGRWTAKPGIHVLVVQDPETRSGYPESVMQEKWPRTLEYLLRFREELLARALYRKYHREQGHPFYSQFNVARDTFGPHKVVWKRMSNDLAATVVSDCEGPLGRKMAVPLETTTFVAARSEDEAHYLCALLNSRPVREFVRSFSAAGRGFGTPSILPHIGIPRFDPESELHRALAAVSRRMHGS